MRLKYHKKVMSAVSAQDTVGTPPADQVPHCHRHNIVVEFGAGTSAGAVVVEEAARPEYAGTWVTLATISWAVASKVGSASVDSVKGALRTRISVAIVGGTIDTYMDGLG